jgi:Fe-Mn family superoxide dismutase
MKGSTLFVYGLSLLVMLSCSRKKLTEVVEVPLPSKDDKMVIGNPEDVKADEGAFEMAKLPYNYEALVPHIDALTSEIHFSKHYLTYTNNLNKLVAGTDMEALSIEELLKKSDASNPELRNNAGGFYNHTFFFEGLTNKSSKTPKDTLASLITRDFGSFEGFKSQFTAAASKQFGSGWAWLIIDASGKLQVCSTPNQDNPLMPIAIVKGKPLLALDVWEHAYYLNYQYKRKKYIDAFFNIINWEKVSERFENSTSQKTS